MDAPPDISWSRFTAFMRQHTHDIRNHLNGLDLEAALLAELTGNDEEVKGSVRRLRQQIRDISLELRSLSGKFAPPSTTLSQVSVRDLFLIWKDQASTLEPTPRVEWHEPAGEARVNVDLDAMAQAFHELLANAVAFGIGESLRAEAEINKERVTFTLTEPKADPIDFTAWGKTPLLSTRRGGYGLGLWLVARNVAGSGGEVTRHFDPQSKTLSTILAFPVV